MQISASSRDLRDKKLLKSYESRRTRRDAEDTLSGSRSCARRSMRRGSKLPEGFVKRAVKADSAHQLPRVGTERFAPNSRHSRTRLLRAGARSYGPRRIRYLDPDGTGGLVTSRGSRESANCTASEVVFQSCTSELEP